MKKALSLIILFLLFLPVLNADNCYGDVCEVPKSVNPSIASSLMPHDPSQICIVYFYTDTCSNCAKLKPFIDKVKDEYGSQIHLNELEISHNLENYHLYSSYCNIKDLPLDERGVPFIAVGHKYFMGLTQIKDSLESEINSLLDSGERVCPLTGEEGLGLCAELESSEDITIIPYFEKKITPSLVIITGLVDGVNPCAFAVLIFLITFLLQISSTKKRMIKAGSVYILSVYISYFLAGFGLLSIIQLSGASNIIVKAAAIVAILAGLINIKDFFWYGKGITLQIPSSKKPVIERWTRKANIPAAFILGFLVSMFELPCTGGVYLAIIAMLADTVTKTKAISYLLIYNIMFVLPLIVILLAVVFGMRAEHIENWRRVKKNWMKLTLGLLLFVLGIAMLFGFI